MIEAILCHVRNCEGKEGKVKLCQREEGESGKITFSKGKVRLDEITFGLVMLTLIKVIRC